MIASMLPGAGGGPEGIAAAGATGRGGGGGVGTGVGAGVGGTGVGVASGKRSSGSRTGSVRATRSAASGRAVAVAPVGLVATAAGACRLVAMMIGLTVRS